MIIKDGDEVLAKKSGRIKDLEEFWDEFRVKLE